MHNTPLPTRREEGQENFHSRHFPEFASHILVCMIKPLEII